MTNIITLINDKLWIILIFLIMIISIYYSFKFHFIQFRFDRMFKYLFKKNIDKDGISSFNTLMLALAGRIGVGSISGVALAIYLGGPGTIFWIWIICILATILTYCETYLGIKYRQKDGKYYKGGPAYYIKNGLNNKLLGSLYAILIIITYVIFFVSIQSNTITKAVTSTFCISPLAMGIILAVITTMIIFGGLKKISDATSKIVPVMSVLYICLAIYIIIVNYSMIPKIFSLIITNALNVKSFISGFIPIMITGVQRGIFSSEAGIGTGSIAASSGTNNNPIEQGYIQMLGIYITAFLICTSTAIIILCSNYSTLTINDPNGIEIATSAFQYHLGSIGNYILILSIILFAFSTVLSGYYYGESSLKYFFNKENSKYVNLLKIITIIVILYGSVASSSFIWAAADLFVCFLAMINIYAIFKLRKQIKK